LFSGITGGTQTVVVREQGAEGNVWKRDDEMSGGWRSLHNEELRNLYSLQNIVRIIKSRRMR
jgi:hypothetical protein